VAAGQRNTAYAAAATDSPTPHLPALPMLFVISQAAAVTFDTQNTVVPPSGVAIGLLIVTSLSFDRT